MPRSQSAQRVREAFPSGHAHAGLERLRLVVDAGVNHFAVARARMHAEMPFAFENDHFAALGCQRPSHREADDARADHNAIRISQSLEP